MADPNIHKYVKQSDGTKMCEWCGADLNEGKSGCKSPAQASGKKAIQDSWHWYNVIAFEENEKRRKKKRGENLRKSEETQRERDKTIDTNYGWRNEGEEKRMQERWWYLFNQVFEEWMKRKLKWKGQTNNWNIIDKIKEIENEKECVKSNTNAESDEFPPFSNMFDGNRYWISVNLFFDFSLA